MLFTSPLFLFFFLPAALIIHRLFLIGNDGPTYPRRAKLILAGLTVVFYGWSNGWWLYPFMLTVMMDFFWASLLFRTQKTVLRKLILTLSISQSVFLLAYLKYKELLFPNFLPNMQQDGMALLLPAGISFYTFESMSFIIDIYRRQIKHPPNGTLFADFLGFIAMFPRFIAGPIARYRQIESQYHNYQGMQLERGIYIFIYGICLKTLFADQFAFFVPQAFGISAPSFQMAWIGVIAYTMQIYFDFLGYSTMAIGLGFMLGFEFPKNFDQPYLATSITDFWRRWHMTLSSWLRDYVYIPLGGSRKGVWRTYLNLTLTMLIGGLWHGSNWTFVLWGAWHGLFLSLERAFPIVKSGNVVTRRVSTLLIVTVGFVFFKSESIKQTLTVLNGLIGQNGVKEIAIQFPPMTTALVVIGLWFCFFGEKFFKHIVDDCEPVAFHFKVAATAALLFAMSILMGAHSVPFLYFQF